MAEDRNNNLYYKHSGRFSLPKLSLNISLSIIISAILALIYCLIDKYNPFIYIQAIITFFLVALLGIINSEFLLSSKVRNKAINIGYGLTIGFTTLYFSWLFWIYSVLDYKYSLLDIVLSPIGLLQTINALNKVYVISVYSTQITGGSLLALWLLESLFIVGGITYYTLSGQKFTVFCESCENWCKGDKTFELENKVELNTIKRVLEAKNLSYLKQLSIKSNTSPSWLRLYTRKCHNCSTTNTLTVSEINLKINNQGEVSEQEKEIISDLLISSQETTQLENICQEINTNANQN